MKHRTSEYLYDICIIGTSDRERNERFSSTLRFSDDDFIVCKTERIINNHCSPSNRPFQPSLTRKRQVHTISIDMENYRVLGALGSGTWGVVHSAEQNGTGRKVAIKKIKSERSEEGVNFTAIREIKLLREFKHPNIIELVDVFSTPDMAICLVYEIAETDLEKILNNKQISINGLGTK